MWGLSVVLPMILLLLVLRLPQPLLSRTMVVQMCASQKKRTGDFLLFSFDFCIPPPCLALGESSVYAFFLSRVPLAVYCFSPFGASEGKNDEIIVEHN